MWDAKWIVAACVQWASAKEPPHSDGECRGSGRMVGGLGFPLVRGRDCVVGFRSASSSGLNSMVPCVDKQGRMTPNVVVTATAEMLPFGVLRGQWLIPVGPQNAEADNKAAEPVLPEPTTLVNHIISSAPASLIRP